MNKISLVQQNFETEQAEIEKWSMTTITNADAKLAYTRVLGGYDNFGSARNRRHEVLNGEAKEVRNIGQVMDGYYNAPGAEPGSVWGWVNGMTYYLTHAFGRDNENRQVNWIGGRGKKVESETIDLAKEIVRQGVMDY